MATELLPFQAKGVRKLHHFKGRSLLADEMGLGKTVQGLFYAKEVPKARPVVVVCPAFHKYNWEQEARDHVGMRAQILEGQTPNRRVPMSKPPLVIINYDILPYWVPYLRKLDPQLVVLDECRYIKNLSTKRTKAARKLCFGVPMVIAMDGTGGMDNRPAELFPSLNIIRPELFPSYFNFGQKFCGPRFHYGRWEFKGASHTKELHELLNRTCMIRRLKKDVLEDLPEKVRQVLPVDIQNFKEYSKAETDFKTWLKKTVKRDGKIRRALRAEGLVKIGYLKRLAAQLKLKVVMEWIDNFLESPRQKLIVFAIHKKTIIHKLRERYGKRCVCITGDTSKERRKEYFHRFNNDKKCRLLIGQLRAVGVAWSAKSCNNVLFAELGWTPAEHEQAEDRVHGLYRGVEGKRSFIYYLVAKNTIEERICSLLETKKGVLDSILDGKRRRDFNIHRELMKGYISERRAA